MKNVFIFENIKTVCRNIARGALKANRCPSEVQLVVVTKTVDTAAIRTAVDSGIRVFGENRVQEAKKKILSDEIQAMPEKLQWHLIGHLQKNKAKDAVQLFEVIHSVDSIELAEELNRQAGKIEKIQRILVQVKLSEEETKSGVVEEGLPVLLKEIAQLKNLRLEGLMTIPPFRPDVREVLPYFRRLRDLRDESEKAGFRLPELSMGMSHDYEEAIGEGATMVRIGTAIFGERC
ncbi:MAG: YggS family pyridoxal phosphate-dependent enzyme [Nitrospirae bacterium]|nr:YggS family pyridoxal phosphate-dependent enzyme [Nitrospirota bacterium]